MSLFLAAVLAAAVPAVPVPVSAPAPGTRALGVWGRSGEAAVSPQCGGPGFTPGPHSRRGPIDSRDEFLLAQPRLTLPALSPDPLPAGETRWRLAGDWGNDFGYRLRRQGDVRRTLYFVDGEHRSAVLSVSHGLGPRLTAGARLPLLWRGGGVLDGLIDRWHRLTGLPDSNRPQFPRDELNVHGLDPSLQPIAWSGGSGSALGPLELALQWSLGPRGRWATALATRVQLPTAGGSFGGGGVQAGAQLLAAHGLGGGGDVYLGLGGTAASARAQQGLTYARLRPGGFVAFEWRPWRAVSLLAQGDAASRLVRDVESFPGLHLTLKMGARIDVAPSWRLQAGFSEGLHAVSATTDFGVMVGLERSIRPRRR